MGKRRKISIGLLGSGVVGEAIQDIVFQDLDGKVGDDLELVIRRIFTRDPRSKKWFSSRASLFTDKADEVIDDPEVDIVIEALGFQEASQLPLLKKYILRAFENGKPVVTSDKAVLARFGDEIWAAAAKSGQALRFEGCVGGGIPIIRSLSESFAVEEPQAVFGIVNGTCNYILSQMEMGSKPYARALKEAQVNGFAETNPAADVSGSDAEAKLLLLVMVAFGLQLKPGTLWRKGIEDIHGIDFLYAARKGSGTIKHLAVAKRIGAAVRMYVSPALIPHGHFLARIDGATNAICVKGRKSGGLVERDCDYVFVGPGAGGGPTAVAILGDVCALARGEQGLRRGISGGSLAGEVKVTAAHDLDGSFYVRFLVKDRAGIIGNIGETFGREGVNISEIWQLAHSQDELKGLAHNYKITMKPTEVLPFVITLEHATVGQMQKALAIICHQDYVLADPVWFPIWSGK
jgi:homoserine dehydrogenase